MYRSLQTPKGYHSGTNSRQYSGLSNHIRSDNTEETVRRIVDKFQSYGFREELFLARRIFQLRMPETEHRVRRRMFRIQEYFHNTRQICSNRPQCCSTPAAAPYQQASEELPVRR